MTNSIDNRRFEHFASQLNCHPSELLPKWKRASDAFPGSMPPLTPLMQAEVCLMVGAASLKEKNLNKALVWLKAGWEIYQNLKDLRGLAEASYLLATGHNFSKNPNLALTYYQDAEKLFQQLRDNRKIALCHNGLGALLLDCGQNNRAKVEFDRAFEIYQTIPENQQVTGELINIQYFRGIVDGILSSEKID